MMSEFGYFTRLIEMTNRGSKGGSKTNKDEAEEEMRNNSDDSQISTHTDKTDIRSEIFTDMSNDDLDHHDANHIESEMSRVVIQDNVLDLPHISEKKHAKSQPSPSSNGTRTQSDKNEYEMEKQYDDNFNAIDSKSAPFSIDISEKRLESNPPEGMSKIENQLLTSTTDERLGKSNSESDQQFSSDLESLLQNSILTNPIKESIDKMINSKVDQNSSLGNPSTYSHNTKSDGSLRNDHISVSIDTIVIKVSNDANGSDPKPVQYNLKRNKVQDTDRLRRYYLRLR
jgi:hypothetical protein